MALTYVEEDSPISAQATIPVFLHTSWSASDPYSLPGCWLYGWLLLEFGDLWPRYTFGHLTGLHNKALWCGADIVEGIASDQSELGVLARVQHTHVPGVNDLSTFHLIGVTPVTRLKDNKVILGDRAERSKQRVTMTGNADIAALARKCGAGNVPEAEAERALARAFVHKSAHV